MAWDVDIDARAMPTANKEAASIFIGIPFCLLRGEIIYGQTNLFASPVTVVVPPVTVVPVTVMPAVVPPVMMMPVTMMPVMVTPVHLHGLDLIDLVLRHDRRLNVCHRRGLGRDRRYGCSLRACGKQDRARDQPSSEFQKSPKFHDFSPLFSK